MEVYNSQGADAAYEYANAYIAEQNALNSLKDSYTENNKTSLKETEDDVNKLKNFQCSWVGRQYC